MNKAYINNCYFLSEIQNSSLFVDLFVVVLLGFFRNESQIRLQCLVWKAYARLMPVQNKFKQQGQPFLNYLGLFENKSYNAQMWAGVQASCSPHLQRESLTQPTEVMKRHFPPRTCCAKNLSMVIRGDILFYLVPHLAPLVSHLENPGFWIFKKLKKELSAHQAHRLILFSSLFYSSMDMQANTSKHSLVSNTPCFYMCCFRRNMQTQRIKKYSSLEVSPIQALTFN